ncbi:D-glycero-beta-D-manno-heptose 1-phosphate adenylyltransferase [Rhizobium sp. BK251]|uniref:D-glycero-beta-D-manno-heptose 1-phosphate adenylyltransferase n=1 Tax=Rhizobium sp. BK251 TaxID=2512125 RepID=UPI00104E8BD2|nr:D-glycero-beta-D-manno-heptose 1-phosphate adenylyltransferase [Rhizobium sp. BK251]TCL66370.1 D-alpha,beta-D-heptose 7-phosphate 1-kinase /D-beta-D-heptose 1-phosphate adenylyltransferase [Rhizobium sp. BK251]
MIVDNFHGCRILVVGDVMLDHYVRGTVSRVSPEAPALVLQVVDEDWTMGGAGNAAANIASLGGVAVLLGLVGNDPAGIILQNLNSGRNTRIETRLCCEPGFRTIQKTRFLAQDRHLLRADRDSFSISRQAEEGIITAIGEASRDCAAMVISDYAKGVITPGVVRALAEVATRRGIPLVVDPKQPDFSYYRGCTVLTPNRKELALASGIEADSPQGIAAGIKIALRQFGGPIVLTRSEQGMSLFRPGARPVHEPARTQLVRDVSGAGDTVVAALSLALASGESLPKAMAVANVAASVAVAKSGTATVSPEELAGALLVEAEPARRGEKLGTLSLAYARRETWRREGLTVGFTNGCFDILHPGHVKLLKTAKAQCDRLIVALNTDASVRRLKGPDRPVQLEGARAVVIAAFDSVDLVMLFDDDTPMEFIQVLRPDVLFKGADYTLDDVVGGAFVRKYGGRVVLVDLEADQSTTNLITRARMPHLSEVVH